MATKEISVQRFSLKSPRPFDDVVAALEATIGHPDMKRFQKKIAAAKDFSAMEKTILRAVAPSGLMELLASTWAKSCARSPEFLRLAASASSPEILSS